MADDSFTRSLYIGRDKAVEVAKRREAAEAELKARREERIRIQNERLQRAAQMKENELREKCRQKQEKEMQRQRAVLDRRSARMEEQKAKAEELLHRVQHSSTARHSNNGNQKTTRSTYVFGSSTPRELSYLERLTHEQKAYNSAVMTESKTSQGTHSSKERSVSNERPLTTAGAKATPLRLPSHIAPKSTTSGKRPTTVQHPRSNTLMTRSVFGTLNSGVAAPTVRKVPAPRATPVAGTKLGAGKRGTSPMTQSMYVTKTPTAAGGKDPTKLTVAFGRLTAPTAASASRSSRTGSSKSSAESNASEHSVAAEPVRKPVVRPRKAVETMIKNENSKQTTAEPVISESTNAAAIEQQSCKATAPVASPRLIVESAASDMNVVSELSNPLQTSSTEEAAEDEVEKASPKPEQGELLIDIFGGDSTPRDWTPTLNQQREERGELIGDGAYTSATTIVELGDSASPRIGALEPSPISNSSNSPASVQQTAVAAAEQDREREERRERLNQILQRTRMDNAAAAAAATAAQTNAIDASALAQDLLAQRRQQKLQQQQQQALVANGHGENGVVHAPMNGSAAPLPGQVIVGAMNEENPLFEQQRQHRGHRPSEQAHPAAVGDAAGVKDIGSLLSQLTTADTGTEGVAASGGGENEERHVDPEDPRTNGSAARKETGELITQP